MLSGKRILNERKRDTTSIWTLQNFTAYHGTQAGSRLYAVACSAEKPRSSFGGHEERKLRNKKSRFSNHALTTVTAGSILFLTASNLSHPWSWTTQGRFSSSAR